MDSEEFDFKTKVKIRKVSMGLIIFFSAATIAGIITMGIFINKKMVQLKDRENKQTTSCVNYACSDGTPGIVQSKYSAQDGNVKHNNYKSVTFVRPTKPDSNSKAKKYNRTNREFINQSYNSAKINN